MADITITGITLESSGKYPSLLIGEDVPAWSFIAESTTVDEYVMASAATGGNPNARYLTVEAGLDGEYVICIPIGYATIPLVGPTLVQAQQYVLSATPGKAAPRSDLASTDLLTTLFIGDADLSAQFNVKNTLIVIP